MAILALAGAAQAGPYDTWGKYKTLTINTTNAGGGANVTTTQTNFPVLIRLTTATAEDILGEALANGADLRFASSDGSTALSYQIERWSSTTAEIWVLVPSVAGNSTTDIRVYWLKAGQSDASSGSSVFSTSNGFKGVWHLGETGNSSADGYLDATGNAAHAQGTNFGSGNEATATVGKGQTFASASSRKITVKAAAETNFDITSAITVSAWINVTSWTVAWQAILTKGDLAWRLARNNTNGTLNFSCTGLTTNTSLSGGTTLSTGTWYYVTGVYDGSNLRMYLNGASDATAVTATGSIGSTNDNVAIGENTGSGATGRYFNGLIDEARVESSARSADWIKLSYQTQRTGATCVVYGSTQATTFYWNRNDIITSSTDFSMAYNWTMNADGTGRRMPSLEDDDFTAGSRDAAWTCQDSDNNGGAYDCNQTDRRDRLWLTGFGADIWTTLNEFIALRRSDITGDFDVSVRVDSIYNTHSAAKAGLYMADDFTNLTLGGYAGMALRGDLKLELSAATGTANQLVSVAVSASSITPPVWLRLVKNSNSVTGYYRTSLSSAWTNLGGAQTPVSTSTNSQIGLVVCSHNAGLATVGVFDEFQGGTTNSGSSALDLSFAGTGSNADANATLSVNETFSSVDFTGYTGTFNFGSYTLSIGTGNATFASGMTITTGTGTLAFTGSSGTQVLTPASGKTLPTVSHTGASTLQLSTTTLTSVAYSQSAGILDFNGVDVTTTGNFTLTNGTASSFSNLSGRTLAVGGNASFTGSSGNLVNLNPTAWTITATGTLTADYASIAGSDASAGSAGTATHSTDGGSNSNWAFSVPATLANLTKSVRLNFNTTAAGVTGNVANFPLFIRFTTSNLTFSSTSETGADLIFVDKDGTTLYHQVVEWDKANKTGKVWVRVPQVDGSSTTDYITLYYGCDSCTTNSYARSDSVFTVFKSVFHLNAPEAKAYDATTLANHGTFLSNLPNLANGGIVTKNAAVFDGSANSYIDVPNESNYDLTTNISVYAWIKVGSFSTAYQAILTKGSDAFRLTRHNNTNFAYFACTKTAATFQVGGAVNLNDGNWHLVVGTYAGDSLRLYVDGARDGGAVALTGSITVNNSDLLIGENNGTVWNGDISEVRIGNTITALSSDFIKLSYATQKENSTFLTSYTTASFQSSKVFKLNTTPSGANITGDVTDFPLLLRFTGVNAMGLTGSGTAIPTDLRFLDDDGVTWLDYQVGRWDRTGGVDSGEVWVKVPTIEGNYAGHTITMYYKQASGVSVVDGQCGACVFSAYNGVYHLGEDPGGSAPQFGDSSGNANTGTAQGTMVTADRVSALAGKGVTLNGSSKFIYTATQFVNPSTLTNSLWFKTASSYGSGGSILNFGNSQTGASGSHDRHIWMRNDGKLIFGVWNGSGQEITSASAYNDGNWHHVAVRFSNSAYSGMYLYVDGAQVATSNNTTVSTITGYWRIGYDNLSGWTSTGSLTSSYFAGTLDEVHIAHTEFSPDYIKLEYQNGRRDSAPLFNPSPADFRYSQKLTFNTTKTGANVTGNVSNFPLLVRLTGLTAYGVNNSGTTAPTDIRFLDGDGKTWLNYQVERWDRTGGIDSAEIWVLVPQVDGNSDHDFITMYYQANGVTVADGQCASCVFSTSDSHTGVWHLSEETGGTGTASVYRDATGNAYHGTDMISATGRIGVAGWGHQFDGTDDYIRLVAGSTLLPNTSTPVTLSAWLNTGSFTAGGTRIFGMPKSDSTTAFGLATVNSTTNRIDAFINGSSNKGATTLSTSTWYHAALSWDGTTYRLYVNGTLDSSYVAVMAATTSATGRIGIRTTDNLLPFSGYLDEVEFSRTARSADWIKLEYETQRRSGSLFWNSRVSPNNKAVLTATATSSSNIALSWPSTVSDSSNADSVGIWVGYSAYPDSANVASATLVARLAKTDTAYSYPATYPTTYYFALAVRNTSGKWSPFTSSSSDSVTLAGVTMPDTIYVDSARGNNGNTCTQAQSPATPRLTITSALTCGASATDTLVIRVMPGAYASDNAFAVTSSKPSVVTSFDNVTRAVLAGNGSVAENGLTWNYAVSLSSYMCLRNMDVRANATSNAHNGVYVNYNADYVDIVGNRIYGTASYAFDTSITVAANNNEGVLIANNLIHKPVKYGVRLGVDDDVNVMHNTFIGPGTGTTKGLYVSAAAWDAGWYNFTNNIFYNWTTGIETVDGDNEVGNVSNNLFFLVTSGSEVVKETDAGKIVKDPLFANMSVGNPNAFKLLPGSPAIDAGTATRLSTSYAYNRFASSDHFGSSRSLGSAADIGMYEGTGYTPDESGEFDTLTVSSTATTVTVQNSKWKLVWDQGRGAGITEFYDKASAPSTNILAASSLLFDAKIGTYTASAQTSAGPLLYLTESSRARAVIRQRLAVSASVDLNIYYSVYPSGHIYIESEIANLAAGNTSAGTVDYTLKMGTATAAYTTAGTKNGFGYLNTSSRSPLLAVTRDLDGGASAAETWSTSTATSGASGTVIFKTTAMATLSQNTVRRHDFLLYIGDNSLDFGKAAAINADAYTPSPLSMSAGSLMGERSWQEALQGHWTLDDGAGSTARDKSVFVQNNATLGGANYKWVAGKTGGGLYLTATDSAYVASTSALNPANGFTVMFWLKPDFTGMGDTALIVSKGLSNASGWYCRKVANASGTNKIQFTMGAATVTSPSLTDLAWSHIAVVADAGGNRNLEMYVNGVQVAASTAAAVATSNSLNLLMGYGSGSVAGAKFKGTLDDVRVYRRELPGSDVQSIYAFGFSSRYGHYALRADNNNRVVALINSGTAQTRVQPAFYISNWFGPRNPKYVFLNGTKLAPNVDYVVDSVTYSPYGSYLTLQLNKIITGADQTLFIDDDDSTGFMGTATAMKSLTITATSGKIAIKNFSDTVFSGSTSGQWYMELGLKGWTTPTATPSATLDSGFGEIMTWRAAAVSPSVAVSSASQLAGYSFKQGRVLNSMKLDATAPEMFTSGLGYLSQATNTYTLVDSSSTRLSLTLSTDSLTGEGTAAVTKRFTFYPTGRVFVSYQVRNQSFNFDTPRLDLSAGYDGGAVTTSWSTATATANARWALIGGDANFHSIGMALLSVKNNTTFYTTAAGMVSSTATNFLTGSSEQSALNFNMQTSLWTSANKPVTVNYVMDFSRDFTDSASADALLKDSQTPAVLTAITGTRVTNDALDFNGDNFAEADGAYTYAASSGIAHFKFVNTVVSYNPAFRISSWTEGTLPEFVLLDNQVLTKGYQYNAYLKTSTNEVVLQFNKTLAIGTHVIFISHKSGLAVKLNRFEAKGADGVDSLAWTTESEFENLGFHLWRREVPSDSAAAKESARLRDSVLAEHGAGDARATDGADGATAKASAITTSGDSAAGPDTLPSLALSPQELAKLGYVRITPKLIPGAPGGSSASTREYLHIDRTAAFGRAYEYLLEAIDFNDGHVFYGPRAASPGNPYNTEILPNYPNPFNPITTMRFSLREKLKVSLVVYDARGRVVRTLLRPDKPWAAGKYTLIWNARNDMGMEVPSGQYFYRFTAGRYVKARKMILLK